MVTTTRRVTFQNGPIEIVGELHLPDEFSDQSSNAAIVIVTPGSSVKEQIGAVYGRYLAAEGFVTLAFDPAFQGESGGEPRDLESPAARIEDVRCAIDYLATLPFIDEERIGAVGICAGGGYAVSATMIDHRIKALGAVVPVNIGRAFRQAQPGAGSIIDALETIGKQRTTEARGGAPARLPWIPDTIEEAERQGVDRDTMDAVRFYRTPRGCNGNSTNRLLATSNALLLGFDAFHLAEVLLTQPVQIVVGGRLGTTFSFSDGKTLWEKARNAEDFFIVENAGHYEMYDTPKYVSQAIGRLARFFNTHLGMKDVVDGVEADAGSVHDRNAD